MNIDKDMWPESTKAYMKKAWLGWSMVCGGIIIISAAFGIAWGASAAMFIFGLSVIGVGASILSED